MYKRWLPIIHVATGVRRRSLIGEPFIDEVTPSFASIGDSTWLTPLPSIVCGESGEGHGCGAMVVSELTALTISRYPKGPTRARRSEELRTRVYTWAVPCTPAQASAPLSPRAVSPASAS